MAVALVYLIIRAVPDFLIYSAVIVPGTTRAIARTLGPFLKFFYPSLPPFLFDVPFRFQIVLSLLPVLVIEVLLVFLFSAWFLRWRPAIAASNSGRLRWLILIGATVAWSVIGRNYVLYCAGAGWTAKVVALNKSGVAAIDAISHLTRMAYWPHAAALYAGAIVWTWLPVWLHFRFAGKYPRMSRQDAVGQPTAMRKIGAGEHWTMAPSLRPATRFAGFTLGGLVLQIVLLQAIVMGLWPWIAETQHIVPPEAFMSPGLAVTLSAFFVSGLAWLLAAYFYARRATPDSATPFSLFGAPILAGIATYLLTTLVALAFLWLLGLLMPSWLMAVMDDFLRSPGNPPKIGAAFEIVSGIMFCIGLWILSSQMRRSPRFWCCALVLLAICAAVPLDVAWTITRSNLGLAGDRPEEAISGRLGSAHWRSMEQYCTGVLATGHGTWLVGREDSDDGQLFTYIPKDTPDLGRAVDPTGKRSAGADRGFAGSDAKLTTLARRQDDGTFKLVGTIPSEACLVASPKSGTLFLLTGMDFPGPAYPPHQTAVLRSTDQGSTWQLMRSGFMAHANTVAWDLQPVFSSDQDVWAWSDDIDQDVDSTGDGLPTVSDHGASSGDTENATLAPSGLFYSADQGATSAPVYSPEPLLASQSYLRQAAHAPNADFSTDRLGSGHFVVQIDDTHALAWISGVSGYEDTEKKYRALAVTTRAAISRPSVQAQWRVTKVTRRTGFQIEQLVTSDDGQTFAVLEDSRGQWLARLDKGTGKWIERRPLPSLLPHWLVKSHMEPRYFWSNGSYQVVSLWGDLILPRTLFPFSDKRAEITTDAHFYTSDGGHSWHQLAIPGYLGVLGLSHLDNRLYWSQGNWYTNNEPVLKQFTLRK
jgi:hypothetical protein